MQQELSKLTARIIEYRIMRGWTRKMERFMGSTMPLEIKGLKGKAIRAGAMFDRLNKGYDKLIETGEAHANDVESLPSQIDGMQDDLTFMVQTLGNSISNSEQSGKPLPEQPPQTEEISSQEVGQLPPATFHEPNPGT